MARRPLAQTEAGGGLLRRPGSIEWSWRSTQLRSDRSDQSSLLERRDQRRVGCSSDDHAHVAGAAPEGDGRLRDWRLALLAGLAFHCRDGALHARNGLQFRTITSDDNGKSKDRLSFLGARFGPALRKRPAL